MQKKNKANLALGLSAAGFLGTLGVQGGFGAGLLHHGFLAATIGGLADWFAVTAIFRRPLGIAYRTDILRRNRPRIMEAIVRFASEDLLSTENIMKVIREQDTAALMVDYIQHRGGRERVREVASQVLLRGINALDTDRVARELAPSIRDGLQSLPLENILMDLVRLLAEEKHSRGILHSMLTIGQEVLAAPAFQQVMLSHISLLRKEYEGDSAGRAFVLELMDLSDEKMLAILNEKMQSQLQELLSGQTQSYASLKAGLETMLMNFSRDESLHKLLKEWKDNLVGKLELEPLLSRWLEANVKGEEPFWLPGLRSFVDSNLDSFVSSAEMQQRFDAKLKDFLEAELAKHHRLIPGIIRERLEEFSDDELVEFVEDKVQDDLQMIRINGAIVGALVGMGLYILVTLAERMWGL
ncbi:MAG: DUF445 domain-containing protein [Selenomonas sp.]|nr:DUF445 domain-containing protein [Selenomonas sp.]